MSKVANRVLTPGAMARMQMRLANSNYVESAGLLMQWNIAVSALSDKSLSNSQKRVLGAILTVSENNSGQAMVNRDVIAMMTGLSPQVVSNCISVLQKLRYIEVFRASNGQGQGTASVYQLYGMTDSEIEAYTSALEAAHAEMLGVNAAQNRPDTANLSRDITEAACENGQMQLTYMISSNSTISPNRLAPNRNITNDVSSKSQDNEIGDVTHARARDARVHDSENRKEKNKQQKKKAPRSADEVPAKVVEQFEEFWKTYPAATSRKGGKTEALLMFWDITRGDFTSNPADGPSVKYPAIAADRLIHCARCLASEVTEEARRFVPGVCRWFNSGKWEPFLDRANASESDYKLVVRGDRVVRVRANGIAA